jgi:hypothetical protein
MKDVRQYVVITDQGREYLRMRAESDDQVRGDSS